MYGILLVLHVLVAIALVGLILIQQGKGAQTGASFGSGASQTVFGSQGSGGFLSNATAALAAIFFLLNLSLAVLASRAAHHSDIGPMEKEEIPVKQQAASPTKKGEATQGTDVPEVEQ